MEKKLRIKDVENIIKDMDVDSAIAYLESLKSTCDINLDRLMDKYRRKKASLEEEKGRFAHMCKFEKDAYQKGYRYIAGVDEAGRGPLAGPVVAAAVILPEDVFIEKLNDSKKLSPKQRDMLYDIIMEKAVAYGIGMVDEKCIDEINILNATKKAMSKAIEQLNPKPDLILTDAVKLEEVNIEQIHIVKGDTLSVSIAAASIIAKVTRDRIITGMDGLYPQYGFAKHKGYGTKEHIDAIKKYGICPIHRVSFTKHFTV
ncbi:ribonuclease HII [Clostridium thermosuccinogenes]|jgi:ribonuclease HII|uniref:Ribonuclease HII n=1 Tax=Clostridium thermosuccinogenes TaxID=84032 RepID=A0A2K2FG92_9CLOT|nr:ribonuclease HII [Pseudoclostridium thermosuccinogenes]AUS98740.1 ribonuclease HII [Pseudoclostridium thermosuccinogenes]PNT97804.1 ribonuclease HII [Pseudoclostridium thermosuccinogenes]PNT99793.1 ribonuclease HII [Pseudoclostridium thermosuccinogenes]